MEKSVRTTEKYYMACDSSQEGLRAEYGPFTTSGQAEREARKLGWNWVVVYTHIVIDDAIVDVKSRFYELAPSIDTLRSVISGVKPLDAAELKFFEQYETQMNQPEKK